MKRKKVYVFQRDVIFLKEWDIKEGIVGTEAERWKKKKKSRKNNGEGRQKWEETAVTSYSGLSKPQILNATRSYWKKNEVKQITFCCKVFVGPTIDRRKEQIISSDLESMNEIKVKAVLYGLLAPYIAATSEIELLQIWHHSLSLMKKLLYRSIRIGTKGTDVTLN